MRKPVVEGWLISLLTLYSWFTVLFGVFGVIIGLLFPERPLMSWTITGPLLVSGGAGFYLLWRMKYRLDDFCAFLESMGFKLYRKSRSAIFGEKGSIYLFGFFYGSYTPSLPEFGVGEWFPGPANIQFYIPCKTDLSLNHTVGRKADRWIVRQWGGFWSAVLPRVQAEHGDALKTFLAAACADIPFLHLSQILTSSRAICVTTGPARLVFRGLLRDHLPYVVMFLERLQEHLECRSRPHSFGPEFERMSIDQRVHQLQKSFVPERRGLIFR